MPPKRVTMAPETKGGEKETKVTKPPAKNKVPPSRSDKTSMDKANPFQRQSKNMPRAGDIRKQRDHFQNIIAEERAQKQRELQELHDKIEYYKKDNEKLLRQQKTKFGLYLDDFKDFKQELERARATNDALYREVEARKEECDKLQYVMDDVIEKINDVMLETNDLNRERKMFEREREQVTKNEMRIHALVQSNKAMRRILLTNKINPNVDASTIKVKTASPKSMNDPDYGTRLPTIYNKNNILSFRNTAAAKELKRKSQINILRRTRSNHQADYQVGNHGFLTRRQSEILTRRNSVDVYI